MAIWRIEVFADKSDEAPIRTGYCNTSSEGEAVELACQAMGGDPKANIDFIQAKKMNALPLGEVMWVAGKSN